MAVGADANQALWIELYIGRERKAGIYRGTIAIDADGKTLNVPIELQVLDFTLPDENSMDAMLFYTSDQPELYHGRNLDAAYDRLAHRNRMQLVHEFDETVGGGVVATVLRRRLHAHEWLRGTRRGRGATRSSRARSTDPGVASTIATRRGQLSDRWMTFLRDKLPNAITFLYMPDEPNPSAFPRIRTLAENIHSNPGPGKALPIFVTHSYAEGLDGAIDIWDAAPGRLRRRSRGRRAREGATVLVLQRRPARGSARSIIDAPATDARASMWAAFKHDVEVYFFWHVVHWRHNSQKQGERRSERVGRSDHVRQPRASRGSRSTIRATSTVTAC